MTLKELNEELKQKLCRDKNQHDFIERIYENIRKSKGKEGDFDRGVDSRLNEKGFTKS